MTDATPMMISESGTLPVRWASDSIAIKGVNCRSWHDFAYRDWAIRPWDPIVTTSTTLRVKPSATEAAFKIVSTMMEDGLVDGLTVNTFVKLVDDVAKIVRLAT